VHASYVEIGRRGRVKGLIKAEEVVVGRGAEVEDIDAKRIVLERDVRAGSLRGETIRLEPGCRVSGEVHYTRELDAARDVSFAKNPEKV